MKRAVFSLVILLLGLSLLPAADEPGKADKSPLAADGFFQQAGGSLKKMFPFTFEGAHLKLDRKAWGGAPKEDALFPGGVPAGFRLPPPHPIEAAFREVQKMAGVGGSSGGTSGEERTLSFTGGKLSGRLHTRGQTVRHLRLEESEAPHRTLDFTEDGKGGFRIEVTHADGDLVLMLQGPRGEFRSVAFLGRRTVTAQGESFTDCYRQNRAALEADILPILLKFGVEPIMSPRDPKVRQAVLAQLVRSPETLAEGKKLLAELDSDEFEVREKASKLLNSRFVLYEDLIRQRLKDPAISLDVQGRLNEILAKHADAARVSQSAEVLELTKDAPYLVTLLEGASADEAGRVIKHLEKLTGQNLGTDPKAWREWATKNAR